MSKIVVTLGWPKPALSPNARVHWSVQHKAKAVAKHEAFHAALEAGARHLKGAKAAAISFDFTPPTTRNRDQDNLIATMKAALDGISQAIGIDDCMFTIERAKIHPAQGMGSVAVTVEART